MTFETDKFYPLAMNAYEVLKRMPSNIYISRQGFNNLLIEFRVKYLNDSDYAKRVSQHRKPTTAKNEILQELYDYINKIQYRQELHDLDIEKNIQGYVCTKIGDIFNSNKKIKSLYDAIKEYCTLRRKDFNVIAVHVAEYRALNKICVKIRREINNETKKNALTNKSAHTSFTQSLIQGIRQLQSNDTNAHCIMNVRFDKGDKESSFRDWFKDFFAARYPNANVTAEEEKGKGRIDLKVSDSSFGNKIIEFKGWWNQDRKQTPEQICSYLTDFEKEGYIFMINHLTKKDISLEYKRLITHDTMNYIPETWAEHKIQNADISFFESRHKFSVKEKTIYHFIFNVHFSNQL